MTPTLEKLGLLVVSACSVSVVVWLGFRELQKNKEKDQRWRQVLALVDDVDGDDLRLYIPQWNPQDKLYVSILALPTELRNSVKAGQWLLAKAQVQSEDRSGVLLRDFEMSPEPDPNDGLA